MVSKKNAALVVCGALGVLFLVAGCVLIHVFSREIHDEVVDNVPLKNDSKSFKLWSDPSSPIYFQVWMYDIVNHLEVLDGDKPVLAQKGPYTYREHRHKFDISYNNNGTLNYRERISYVFQPDMSVGSENDTFVTINLPLLTIMYLTQYEYSAVKTVISFLMRVAGETFFLKLSVHDLMWGYHDSFLSTINTVAKDLKINITINEIFGLFYNKNNTDDGLYEIYSGLDGVDNFGQIVTWNGKSELNYWTSHSANMINGSDGTIYPPFVDTSETKYLFSSDLCRSLGLVYGDTVKVKGIELKKFVAPDIMFANYTVNPGNAGFCTPSNHCLPSGLLNASVCREGAPVVMSMPHFLGCDEETINGVIGLNPNREEHESYIDIESMTGVAMNVGKKLQINTYLKRIDGYSYTNNIQSVFLPIMWLNESAKISDSDAADFRSQVLDKITLTKGIQFGLIALGAVLILLVIVILVKMKICWGEDVSAINSGDDEPLLIPAA